MAANLIEPPAGRDLKSELAERNSEFKYLTATVSDKV